MGRIAATPGTSSGFSLFQSPGPRGEDGRVSSRGALSAVVGRAVWMLPVLAVAFALWAQWPARLDQPAARALATAAEVAFVVTGCLLHREPDQRRVAWLFIALGFAGTADHLSTRDHGPWPFLGLLATPWDEAFMIAILLLYPRTRITDRINRIYLSVVIGWAAVLQPLAAVTWDPAWGGYTGAAWWPTALAVRALHPSVVHVYWYGAAALIVVGCALLARRIVIARGLDRRELRPVVVAGAAVAATILIEVAVRIVGEPGNVPGSVWIAEEVALLCVPAAFLASALRQRLNRAAVADLVLQVARPTTVAGVRDALRTVFADPSLTVLTYAPTVGGYLDADGSVADPDDGRVRMDVSDSTGAPLAVVLTDTSPSRHRSMAESALAAVALNLENARLHAELVARLRELQASRARIVEAGIAERRNVERNLHDGAQQRLLALAATLGRVHGGADDPDLRELVDQARAELRSALGELRDLARGIHPAMLEQVGLGAAVETVAERLPLPVGVQVRSGRLPTAVLATAYFVICEALANTVKHAHATRAAVHVEHTGGFLVVRVHDDGRGGAEGAGGGGLIGLADRVGALGGELTVESRSGEGTVLTATIPCG